MNRYHYSKDEAHEHRLLAFNQLLEGVDDGLYDDGDSPRRAVLMLTGPPRSGHTLLAQAILSRFRLRYPTNLMARFWRVPALAARMETLLEEGGVLSGGDSTDYESAYGVTRSADDINEYNYFWRELFWGHTYDGDDPARLDDEQWRAVDTGRLCRVIAALERERGGLPTFFKNSYLLYQADRLARLLPQAVFVLSDRDPQYMAQSILLGREKVFRSRERWFSTRPPGYRTILERPWWEQVAWQTVMLRREVARQASALGPERCVVVTYEELCREPEQVLDRVAGLARGVGDELEMRGELPITFQSANRQQLDDPDWSRLVEAIEEAENMQSGYDDD